MTVDTFIEAAATVLRTAESVPGNGCADYAEYKQRQRAEVAAVCADEVRILRQYAEDYANVDVPGWVWGAMSFID
jgi:hypothetical protein